MTPAYQAQLNAKISPTTRTADTEKGNTRPGSAGGRSAAVIAKEAAARREVVGVGRLAWTNTTFGVDLPCRKYLLADEAQAEELDQHFYRITNTKP